MQVFVLQQHIEVTSVRPGPTPPHLQKAANALQRRGRHNSCRKACPDYRPLLLCCYLRSLGRPPCGTLMHTRVFRSPLVLGFNTYAVLTLFVHEQRMDIGDDTLAVIESLTGPLLAAADPSDAAALIAAEITVRTVVCAVL